MSSRQIEPLVKLRDALTMASEALNEYIETLAPPGVKENKPAAPATVQETTFTILKFEQQTGAKIGEYEVAYKASNIEDKWTHAYNVLRNSNATIKDRYHGEGYEFSYWLYGADKIYRKKLEPSP
jgi:hypothetical protein